MLFKKIIVNNVAISNFYFILFFGLVYLAYYGKAQKLNIIQNDGQSQAKEKSIESSTEVNQNNNSILEENAQFEGEQHIQEESHVQSHTSLESASESSTKGKKRTRGYTHMLDVWDLPDGEFILLK
ncbi:hypothetical protein GmHk_03G006939 [Glycine max]|nr:hypothetical protein GmHk_03G006939 [Glycine max]